MNGSQTVRPTDLQNMGKGKRLRDEDALLKYMGENPKSVKWLNLQWLLKRQEWIRLARRCKGLDVAYRNEALSCFRDDKERRGGNRTPVDIIGFGIPHGGKDTLNPRDIERILPKLRMVAELRKEENNRNDEQDI